MMLLTEEDLSSSEFRGSIRDSIRYPILYSIERPIDDSIERPIDDSIEYRIWNTIELSTMDCINNSIRYSIWSSIRFHVRSYISCSIDDWKLVKLSISRALGDQRNVLDARKFKVLSLNIFNLVLANILGGLLWILFEMLFRVY